MSHFYDRQGLPVYEVKKATSIGLRATHIGDARKLKLVPSVTGVTGQIAKQQLTEWMLKQLLETVLRNKPPSDTLLLSLAEYETQVDRWKKYIIPLSKEESQKAARRGTELHDKLEKYFLTGYVDDSDGDIIRAVKGLLKQKFGSMEWVPEKSFGHKLGYGGKVDLCSFQGDGIVVDFKTKAKDILDSKLLYDDYCTQLAAYRVGLDIPQAKCYNLVISTTKPGTVFMHEWPEVELSRGFEKFKLLLSYWQIENNYISAFGESL